MKHKVKTQTWHYDQLYTNVKEFISYEKAMLYAYAVEAEVIKIFNEIGELVHNVHEHKSRTYA